ncbi:RNA-binding domain-containing protein [Backusella circina FSU 941]|nr:RNA-binding domain-containing protein [Backusella circina FSU 941]
MHSPRENRIQRSPSPRRGRSYSPRSITSSQSYDDRSFSRSRSRSRSFSRRSTSRGDSRSPYRNQYGYRRYYSRSPLPRRRPRRSPPPLPPPPRRFRSRSPPPRRLSRSGPPRAINNACRVYVGNLSFETKWHHLKDFMREAGHVVHADVLTLPNGRKKNIVEYRYPEGAKIAIHTLNKVEFMGRTIFVKEVNDYSQWGESGGKPPMPKHKERDYESTSAPPPKDPRDAPDDCRLFVDNLPFSASWQDMKDLFRRAGRVLHTDIHTDPGSRRSNGTGTVIFADPRDAQNAIDILDGYEWKGRVIEVNEFNNRNRPRLPRVNNNNNNSNREREPLIAPTRPPLPPAAASSSVDIVYQNNEAPKYPMVSPPPAVAQPPPPPPPPPPAAAAAAAVNVEPIYDNVYRYGQEVGGGGMVPPPPPPATAIQSAPIYNMNLIGGPQAHLPTHGQNQVFVNNLPFSTTWQDLIDLFRHVGPVVRSEVLTMNGHPKGSGYVRFEDTTTCAKAIGKFNGYMYGGRQLDIRMDKYST